MIKTFALVVFAWAIYSVVRISSSYAPDFSVFYDAAKGLLTQKNVYAIPLYTGLGYPPFTLLPFILFTLLPYAVAQAIWVAFSFVSFLFCIYLSVEKPTFRSFCIVFIFAFLAFPTKFTLGMGQVNFFALALLLLTIRYKSGVFLGLLFIIKPHFLFLLPLFGFSIILPAVLLLGSGVFVTGLLFGWNQYVYYVQTLPQLLVFAGRSIYYNQGLGAFLSRTLPNTLAGELTLWISLLLVVCAIWFIWNKRLPLRSSIMLFIPIFLLVEPLSWQHHYVFLLPVYVWLAGRIKRPALWTVFWLSYALVAINFQNPSSFFLSHVFFGNVLLLSLVIHETA